jgi:hypothetical protein
MRHSSAGPLRHGEAHPRNMGAESQAEAPCGACGGVGATERPDLHASPYRTRRPARSPSDIPRRRCEVGRACYGSVVVGTCAVAARGAVVSSWIRLVAKRRLL